MTYSEVKHTCSLFKHKGKVLTICALHLVCYIGEVVRFPFFVSVFALQEFNHFLWLRNLWW